MQYLHANKEAMENFQAWKEWAAGAFLVTLPYHRSPGGFRGGGRVARYALGRDYHNLLGKRLNRMGRMLLREGHIGRFRAVTDAAPVLEREWALLGQMGFRGKNTLVLDPSMGPWILLGELLVDRLWEATSPAPVKVSCGSCTRCLDACPTSAFPNPYQLDARRCISYLTIEYRGIIPRELREQIGSWVFGCDVCLEVCPFGRQAPNQASTWGLNPIFESWTLNDLLDCSKDQFDHAFIGSPLKRAGWTGLLRNACIALGNLGKGQDILQKTLVQHPEWLVRLHAAWALGHLGERKALDQAREMENRDEVLEEIQYWL